MSIETDIDKQDDAGSDLRITSGDARKHFLRNTIANIIFFVFNGLTSFFMVPYQIDHLGIAGFGMISLANSVVSYAQIISITLSSTVFRYVTNRIAKNEFADAKQYLNTQTIAIVWFAAIFFPLSCVISYYTPAFINVPPGYAGSTRLLFLLVYASFIISMLYTPFTISQFVKQRFDIKNYIEIASQIIRYGTWIVLFSLLKPQIWHVAVGYVFGAVLSFTATYLAFKMLMPSFRIALRGFSLRRFLEMSKTGGWIAVTQVGVILYLSIDALIINKLISPESVGEYSTILLFAIMLRGLSGMMTAMITPVVLASYARKETESLVNTLTKAVKFVSAGMAVPLGILCGLATPFITWWLGPQFAHLSPLVWLIMAHHVINCGVQPLFNVNVAANKLALPGISTLVGGIIKVVLAIILVVYTDLGIYGVAIASVIGFVANNWIFTPIYAARIMGVSCIPFYRALVSSIVVFALASLSGLALTRAYDLAAFHKLAAAAVCITGFTLVVSYFLLLSRADKQFLVDIIPGLKKRKNT